MNISDHSSAPTPIFMELVQHIAFSLATVQREKERRKLSIIVHNLKESASTDSSVRKQDDINEYKSLLETYIIYIYLGISVSITNAFCLGKIRKLSSTNFKNCP